MRVHLHPLQVTVAALLTAWIGGCGLNPQNVDRDLNANLPEVKTTIFNEAIRGLGRMNVIYGRGELRVMAKPIVDQTGTSLPTQGEIPQDISEMVKSSLNGIGGNILYVPYDPEFMLNTAQTGYSQWGEKLLPNIVLVGGLTEFDRGLVTKEKNLNLSGTAEELGVPIGLEFEDTSKSSLASITLDFNLIDFNTFTGIPFMQAVNNIKVHKTLKEDTLGFTIYGQTLGLRGQIKKVEGRHAAIRLVVQLGVIQVLGKYQKLPYWRLLPNAEPDPVVLDAVREEFYSLGQTDRIAKIQEYLYIYGKDVEITGRLDAKTQAAIEEFKTERGLRSATPISEEVYLALFENLPLDFQAQARRKLADSMLANYQKGLGAVAVREELPAPRAAKQGSASPPKPAAPAELGEVKLWLNKQAFKIGEPMEVFFEVTRPMFVRIVTINSAGQLSTLFPNPYQNDNYVRPGKTYRIPPAGAPVSLTVGAPEGTDKIRAIASLEPIAADSLPLDKKGEFVAGASQKFALAGAEFQVLLGSQSQAALNPGVAP